MILRIFLGLVLLVIILRLLGINILDFLAQDWVKSFFVFIKETWKSKKERGYTPVNNTAHHEIKPST